MHTPAAAFAWELGRRHRWGLAAVAGYALALVALRTLLLAPDFAAMRFAFTINVPLGFAAVYLLAVFSFGLGGDVAARASLYPPRTFALPVTTTTLVWWPMLLGATALATLWLATALLVLRPAGHYAPLWPAASGAAFMMWTQTLMWTSYPLRGMRVALAVAWFVVINVGAMIAWFAQPPELLMLALCAPQLPLAYFLGRHAVARARRGDIPDWSTRFTWLTRDDTARTLPPFKSASAAQAWCEWRWHGRALPVWVAVLLPFELALLFLAGGSAAFVSVTLVAVVLTPPVMAAVVATTVRRAAPAARNDGIAPFTATRPIASAALVGAKLRVTLLSTLAAWLLVIVAVPIALVLSDTWPVVADRAGRLADVLGAPRAVGFALFVVAGCVALTWQQLVQSLYVGLSGRPWLVRTNLAITFAALIALTPFIIWLHDSATAKSLVVDALYWGLMLLAGIKLAAAGWIAMRLARARLLDDRALVGATAAWLLAVLALYAALVWLLAAPQIPRYWLLLLAVLAVPLARVSAAPLALAWNRHR
jgi:hypothetical protein